MRNRKKTLIVIIVVMVISLTNIHGKGNPEISGKHANDTIIATVGKIKISSRQIMDSSSDETLKQTLKKEILIENKFAGEKIPTDDKYIGKLVLIIQKENLRNELQSVVDASLKLKEKAISADDIQKDFLRQSANGDSDYKYYQTLKAAYEYLDAHPGNAKAVREAYNKYLTKIMGKWPRKPKDYGFKIWQSYVRDKTMRRQTMNQYTYYKNLLESNMTAEIKEKIRHQIFILHPEKKIFYILKKCAKIDNDVKKYIEGKNKTGKVDKVFEQKVIDKWYFEQLKKLGCKLYTDKYGTLKDVMTFKKPPFPGGGTNKR